MMPNNHVIKNRHRRQQQSATNNAFATAFAIAEAAVNPPILPAPVPCLDGFAVPPAAEAVTPPAAVTLPRNNLLQPFSPNNKVHQMPPLPMQKPRPSPLKCLLLPHTLMVLVCLQN